MGERDEGVERTWREELANLRRYVPEIRRGLRIGTSSLRFMFDALRLGAENGCLGL